MKIKGMHCNPPILFGLLIAGLTCSALAASDSAGWRDTSDAVGPRAYWVEQLASGLKNPFSFAWLSDDEMLIAERMGRLRVFRHGKLDPGSLSGVPPSFQNPYNGFKGVLVDPDYQSSRLIYLLISEGTYEWHHTAVYRARYDRDGLTHVEPIFRAKDEMGGITHSSARMIFLPDKTLLIAVPEGHYHKDKAQRLDSYLGKMLRINRDGSVPSDNPFLKTPGALPEIWSYGHRVPTGLYWDADTGSVWEVEPGPRGGDELNILEAGGNFGWAKATWGFEYNGKAISSQQFGPGMEDPILVWTPSVTPSGLTRYRGNTYPAWNGDFFVGHLSGKSMTRLRIKDRVVIQQERMLMALEERIREIKVGPDNRIYFVTDNLDGRLLRLQPGAPRKDEVDRVAQKLKPAPVSADLGDAAAADPVKGREAFIQRCSGCHRVGAVVQGGEIGPDLAGAYARRAGSQAGYNYSQAMSDSAEAWSQFALDMFLTDPGRYIPGTTMAAAPVTEAVVRRQIIEFLKSAH